MLHPSIIVPTMPMTLNTATLVALRQRSGLSKTELANRAGLRIDTYSRIESGSRTPTERQALALAHALKVPIVALLGSDK